MGSPARRQLLVIADDYGIGPQTSAGILELARKGVVTGSVLLVNSPYAPAEVARWHALGQPMELGWHPNLTLDAPIASAARVPSLVDANGRFWTLATFLKKLFFGRINPEDIALELQAQLRRFKELVGETPRLVNTHQHIGVFDPVGQILLSILQRVKPVYLRRVREPWSLLWSIRGARKKRAFLNVHGRLMSRLQDHAGFPGNDWLAGITDPRWVKRATFFEDWLRAVPGRIVEMSCHPGYPDPRVLGRDCEAGDGYLERRVDELRLLRRPEFLEAVAEAGFELVAPSRLLQREAVHAA